MLKITRETTYADSLRNYQVELDGKLIGKIANGETRSFNISPGEHVLCMRISWCRSPRINFVVEDDDAISFKCRSALRGAKMFLGMVYILLLPHRYIELTLESSK